MPPGSIFFRDYNSIDAHSSGDATNKSNSDELINETQIKLCLWSNLLASVNEILDEKYYLLSCNAYFHYIDKVND